MKVFGGSNGRRREDIVDFRKFKDRDRIKMQLRNTNQVTTKYIKKDAFLWQNIIIFSNICAITLQIVLEN